jgi:hypothetical protein
MLDLAGDHGDHLDRRCTGADHGDALAMQIDRVIPARRVHSGAGERLDPRDLGRLRLGEYSCRADDEARGDGLAARRLYPPGPRLLVERGSNDLGAQPDAITQPVLLDAVLGVRLQLIARCVHARPVGTLLEGELVAERRDVDRNPGVGVPMPRSADAVALLEHEIVMEARLVELDRRPDAGEAGADDDHLMGGRNTLSIHILRVSAIGLRCQVVDSSGMAGS